MEPLVLSDAEQEHMDSHGETPLPEEGGEQVTQEVEESKPEPVEAEVVAEEPEKIAAEEGGEEEPKVEADGDPEKASEQPEKSETVPRGRFERKARKAFQLEEDLKVQTARNDQLEQRVNRLADKFGEVKPPETPAPAEDAPDPEYDPDGFRDFQARQIVTLKEENTTFKTQHAEAEKRAQSNNAVTDYTARAEAEFTETHEDYQDAFDFIQKTRTEMYERNGLSEGMIQNALLRDAQQLMSTMFEGKGDPAQYIYQTAVDSGYKPKNGTTAVAKGKSAAEEKLDTIERGQVAVTKMDGGAVTAGGLTAEKLGNMSDEDFAAFMEKDPKAAKAALKKFSG